MEFVFLDAPHVVTKKVASKFYRDLVGEDIYTKDIEEQLIPCGRIMRSWLNSDWDVQESLIYLKKVLEKEEVFDGVLGFSQGTIIGTLLIAILENPSINLNLKNINDCKPIKFSIMVCGLKKIDSFCTNIYSNAIHCQSLHLIAKDDNVVSNKYSVKLLNCYKNSATHYFDFGHAIPSDEKTLNVIKHFVDSFYIKSNL
ncbi:hypothetical protein HK099_002132 [Clydaea vesicula]|uniref:Serine hydrolase domain-containing protein n=1 Tax=Clydaea vesicula TaxID=447962 RepID=A0AAD5U5Y1_9FUNG|nr:hypothetical protein HK099_002132 [Clydaea vesicula]